ncbi:MAG: glycosyltransferase, partial [Arcobacteraceae bacterium]
RKNHSIEKKSKIILFRGNDLAKNGLGYLFDAISRLYEKNFTLIIESNSQQIHQLRTKMEKANLGYPYILLENYENIDELFIASDIFILPTYLKYFAVDVIRAMSYKNAVFLMEQNHASEVVDVFSLIQNDADRSTSFKLDSLLINKEELKNIQKENYNKALEYTLDKSIEKLIKIIKESFDI